MGLSATVSCNCWELGLTSAPPVRLELMDPDIPHLADDLDLPYPEWLELDSRLHRWREDCCEHPDMQLRWARIGPWRHVRTFQQTVAQLDNGQLPTLRELLPEYNSGRVRWQAASKALAELELLEAELARHHGIFLIDGETAAEIRAAYFAERCPIRTGAVASGFDAAGIWVERDGEEVFRSAEVLQCALDPSDPDTVEFVGAGTQRQEGRIGFAAGDHHWRVRRRQLQPGDLACLAPLRGILAEAARVRGLISWG